MKKYILLSCLSFLFCIKCTTKKNDNNSKKLEFPTLIKDDKNQTWPQYMGPNGNGKVESEFVPNEKLKIIWKYEYEGGNPTPVVIEAGTTFFATDSSNVYAIDSIGNLKWKIKLDSKVEHSLLVSDSILIATPDSGMLYGINTLDGKIVWKQDGRYDQKNYITDERDYIGNKIITDTTKYVMEKVGMNEAAPILKPEGSSFFLILRYHILALDIKTGKLYYSFPKNISSIGTPLISEDTFYIQNGYQHIHAYDKVTGDLKWNTEMYDLNNGQPFLYKDTLCISEYYGLKKLDKNTGEKFKYSSIFSSSKKKYDIIDGHIHYFSEDGHHTNIGVNYGCNIMAFDLKADKKLWRYNIDSKYITELIMVGDYIYFGDSSGNLGIVHKVTGEQRNLSCFGGASNLSNPLSYANGIIYGTYDNRDKKVIFAVQ